jgi:hypothetical protein
MVAGGKPEGLHLPLDSSRLPLHIMSGSPQDDLRGPDVAQLVALRLVEGHNGGWRLTEIGLQRMASDQPLVNPD